MNRLLLLLLVLILGINNAVGGQKRKTNFHLGLDLQTKYVWRGMEMQTEDAAPVLFPQLNYQKSGIYAYVMGGYAVNGKYSEVDFGLSYTYKWLTVGINDYYYPSTTTPHDEYFNLKGRETGHWLEGMVTISPESIPAYLTLSNFFAGADKNAEGKQAYSTYAELGGHYDFLNDHQILCKPQEMICMQYDYFQLPFQYYYILPHPLDMYLLFHRYDLYSLH